MDNTSSLTTLVIGMILGAAFQGGFIEPWRTRREVRGAFSVCRFYQDNQVNVLKLERCVMEEMK
jgi:hypothetical protein